MLNYTNPFKKYFYSISNGLFEETYTANHLNFNPSKLLSDEGMFFAHQKETISYLFDENDKITSFSGESGIYVAYYFWMQRRMQYYERVYEKIQNVLSSTGGLCSMVLIFAEIINYLAYQYVILFDMKDFMKVIEDSKRNEKNKFRIKINITNNNPNKLCPPKNKNSSLAKLFIKENDIFNKDIKLFKRKKDKKNTFCINNNSLNRNNLLINTNNLYVNKPAFKRNNKHSFSHKNINNVIKDKVDSQTNINLKDNADQNTINNQKKNIIETTDPKNITNEIPNTNTFNFIHYILYLISLKKNYSNIKLYSDFRIKMISEEKLIMCNLNIDKLLKKYGGEKT